MNDTPQPKTTKTCGACKHWQETDSYHDKPLKVRRCGRVKMWWDATEWKDLPDGDYGRVMTPECEGDLAFVQDGSDYRADLITRAEFGCVQWEQADAQP